MSVATVLASTVLVKIILVRTLSRGRGLVGKVAVASVKVGAVDEWQWPV